MDAVEQQETIETYLQHFTKKPTKKKTATAAAKKGPRPRLVLRQPEVTAPAAKSDEEPVVPVEEPEPVVLKQKTTIKIKKNTSRKKKSVPKEP
jgi:hypothetical protein